MELQKAETLAWQLMREFHLTENGWMFWWDDAKRRFGSCSHGMRRITLSRNLTLRNDQPQVEDTIRHEIAHALCDAKDWHGEAWKAMCLTTGAKPVRCYSADDVDQVLGDWQATCEACGRLHTKFRMPKRNGNKFCAHKECVSQFGKFHPLQRLTFRHKNAIFDPTSYAKDVLHIAELKGIPPSAEAKRAGVEHMKAQLRREFEIEEMKARIAELESKLGRK